VVLSAIAHVLSFSDPNGPEQHEVVADLKLASWLTRKYSSRTAAIVENFTAGFSETYLRRHPELSRESRFVDKYQIVGDEIGSGSYGKVYRCEALHSTKEFAVKVRFRVCIE
jgi:hypothetical protein